MESSSNKTGVFQRRGGGTEDPGTENKGQERTQEKPRLPTPWFGHPGPRTARTSVSVVEAPLPQVLSALFWK